MSLVNGEIREYDLKKYWHFLEGNGVSAWGLRRFKTTHRAKTKMYTILECSGFLNARFGGFFTLFTKQN